MRVAKTASYCFVLFTVWSGQAAAQLAPPYTAPPAPSNDDEPPPPPVVGGVVATPDSEGSGRQGPPPRVGFQLGLRTGYSLPLGEAVEGSDLADSFSGQVPIFLEIGGKASRNVFVGGYLGFGFGGLAGVTDKNCETAHASCVGVTFRFGGEIQYHFTPARTTNPWIGYGIGFEGAAQGFSAQGHDESVSLAGLEYGRFMAGVDFRTSDVLGIGPFIDLSIGSYSSASVKVDGVSRDVTITKTATHEWLTFGVRGVFFP